MRKVLLQLPSWTNSSDHQDRPVNTPNPFKELDGPGTKGIKIEPVQL